MGTLTQVANGSLSETRCAAVAARRRHPGNCRKRSGDSGESAARSSVQSRTHCWGRGLGVPNSRLTLSRCAALWPLFLFGLVVGCGESETTGSADESARQSELNAGSGEQAGGHQSGADRSAEYESRATQFTAAVEPLIRKLREIEALRDSKNKIRIDRDLPGLASEYESGCADLVGKRFALKAMVVGVSERGILMDLSGYDLNGGSSYFYNSMDCVVDLSGDAGFDRRKFGEPRRFLIPVQLPLDTLAKFSAGDELWVPVELRKLELYHTDYSNTLAVGATIHEEWLAGWIRDQAGALR